MAVTLSELIRDLDLPPPTEGAVEAWAAQATAHGASPEHVPRGVREALCAIAGFDEDLALEAMLEGRIAGASAPTVPALVRAAIREPEAVLDAAQSLGRHRWPVWELTGRDPSRRAGPLAELGPRLEAAIRPTLEARWHEDIRVEVQARGAEVAVSVRSSGPPRPGPGGDVRLIVRDLLVIGRAAGRVRVAVEAEARRAAYRAALGEILYGDPGWLCGPGLCLAPLLTSPEGALRPTRTVGQARLIGVELAGDSPGARLSLEHPDVLGWVRRLDLGDQLERLQAATLDLALDARVARVELRPPHVIVYDRPREEPAVRAFLVERGLLGGQPRT